MLIRSQDNEKITDRIEFSIVEVPLKGWGVYQPEPLRLFGEYSTFEKAIKALDEMEKHYNEPVYYNAESKDEIARYGHTVFQFPEEDELEDEE